MDSEFNFVVAPPRDRFCPVCTELLTEPFLSDCGHHVCRKCHKRIMASGNTRCPTCQEPNVLKTARLNKHLQREIYDLKVHCKHHVPEASLVNQPPRLFVPLHRVPDASLVQQPPPPFTNTRTTATPRLSTGTRTAIDYIYQDTSPSMGFSTLSPGASTTIDRLRVGCKWVGELRDLKDHLDSDKRKCKYILLPCSFGCGQWVRRHGMKHHKLHECPKRDHTCEYCSYHDSRDIVMEQHLPVCHEFPVKCPNKCLVVGGLKRKQLKAHIDKCPLQEIECPFSSAGCTVKLPRNQMVEHEDTAMRQHLRIVAKQLNSLQESSAPCTLGPVVCPQHVYNIPPVDFIMKGFLEKKQADKVWTSPPYYTHIGGYKFCLKVYPNGLGRGKGTHLSVYAYLMRGEHDDELEWPIEKSVTVELLNQRDAKGHHSITFHLNRYSDDNGTCTSRVVDKETACGYGSTLFISHTDLSYNPATNTEYLQDDCLRLRVSDIVVYSTALIHKTPSWQDSLTTNQSADEFTLTEFSKHKQLNNQYYSPPFYTHPQGYKLCLRVDANGKDSGEGTHVSIFTTLMKGEHDQHLQWPFTGVIIFELLNWREDKEHHNKTLSINSSSGYVRVTQSMYGASHGYRQFIPHSSLLYNPATNTEYLQDDCLRLRVNVTKINTH